METKSETKSRKVLFIFLFLMAAMIFFGIVFYSQIKEFLNRPSWYPHVLFAHIFSVTLFFANAVIGMLWEIRSLASERKEVVLHTYRTVAWLDARFSSPLIILSVTSGILLTLMIGDIWEIGWLFFAFLLFLFSGAVWIISDIPSQYKVKALMADIDPEEESLPEELMTLLKKRLWISLAGVLPLIAVFMLMVYKPYIRPILEWIGS